MCHPPPYPYPLDHAAIPRHMNPTRTMSRPKQAGTLAHARTCTHASAQPFLHPPHPSSCACPSSQVSRVRCLLSHSAAIWGAEMLPYKAALSMGLISAAAAGGNNVGPGEALAHESALVTCSADGTIRLWSLTHEPAPTASSQTAGGRPQRLSQLRTLRGIVYPGREGGEGAYAEVDGQAHAGKGGEWEEEKHGRAHI